MHNPPRNATVLLCVGTSPDRHFKLTAGHIPTGLKCIFVVKDAESIVSDLLALVQSFATGQICQTVGMLIDEVMYQAPMEDLCDGTYGRKLLFSIRTT